MESQKNPSEELIDRFEYFLNIHRHDNYTGFPHLLVDTNFAKIDIKFIFFCPSLTEWNDHGFKYVHGEEMINYIWKSLNKVEIIDDCSRTYNYENWNNYEFLVRYFKKRSNSGSIADLQRSYESYLEEPKKS